MQRIMKWSQSAEKHIFDVSRYYPSMVVREFVQADLFGYLTLVNPLTGNEHEMTLSADKSTAVMSTLDDSTIDELAAIEQEIYTDRANNEGADEC